MGLISVLILAGILLCAILLSWIWPPDSPWSPRWRTSRKTALAAFKLAKVKKGDVVFELGSGEATALMVAAKEFGATGVGIEIEPFRFFLSKAAVMRNGLSGQVELRRQNFFDADLSGADLIYLYLVSKTLNRLIPKLKKELKKGTKIVSYKYEMDLPLKKFDRENSLRLYQT